MTRPKFIIFFFNFNLGLFNLNTVNHMLYICRPRIFEMQTTSFETLYQNEKLKQNTMRENYYTNKKKRNRDSENKLAKA